MRTWMVALIAALVLAAVPAAAVVLTRDDASASRTGDADASDGSSWERTSDDPKADRAERRAERREHRVERKAERREHRAERRAERGRGVGADHAAEMAERAQQHAQDMKAWARCVKEAGDDPAKQVDCERPLPPGLAKKR